MIKTFRLTDKHVQKLKQLADKQGVSESEIIRRLLLPVNTELLPTESLQDQVDELKNLVKSINTRLKSLERRAGEY